MCKIIWPQNFTPGPIYTGRFSRYINIWACLWYGTIALINNDFRTALVSTVFFFPTVQPVTVLNMNCILLWPSRVANSRCGCRGGGSGPLRFCVVVGRRKTLLYVPL